MAAARPRGFSSSAGGPSDDDFSEWLAGELERESRDRTIGVTPVDLDPDDIPEWALMDSPVLFTINQCLLEGLDSPPSVA
tara:strand:- start:589 stop:828 length:240 start_codon:yes stop_codon:yes gene_type:complete